MAAPSATVAKDAPDDATAVAMRVPAALSDIVSADLKRAADLVEGADMLFITCGAGLGAIALHAGLAASKVAKMHILNCRRR